MNVSDREYYKYIREIVSATSVQLYNSPSFLASYGLDMDDILVDLLLNQKDQAEIYFDIDFKESMLKDPDRHENLYKGVSSTVNDCLTDELKDAFEWGCIDRDKFISDAVYIVINTMSMEEYIFLCDQPVSLEMKLFGKDDYVFGLDVEEGSYKLSEEGDEYLMRVADLLHLDKGTLGKAFKDHGLYSQALTAFPHQEVTTPAVGGECINATTLAQSLVQMVDKGYYSPHLSVNLHIYPFDVLRLDDVNTLTIPKGSELSFYDPFENGGTTLLLEKDLSLSNEDYKLNVFDIYLEPFQYLEEETTTLTFSCLKPKFKGNKDIAIDLTDGKHFKVISVPKEKEKGKGKKWVKL